MNLYDIYYLCFRSKWIILGGIVAGLVAATIAAFTLPMQYRSEAKLLVRYVTDTVISDPSVTGENVVLPGRPSDTVINTEIEILSSADLVASAVAALLAQPEFKGMTNGITKEINAQHVARNFQIRSSKESNTLMIYYDGPTAQIAQSVLQQLITVYLERHQAVHKDPGVLEFIARQTDEMRGRLNDTEDELRKLKAQAGIVSFADARQAAATRLQEIDRAIRDAESRLAGLNGIVQSLSPSYGSSSPAPTGMPTITMVPAVVPASGSQDLLRNLSQLYGRESALLATYTTNSVPVLEVRGQIRSLEDRLSLLQPDTESGSPTNSVLTRSIHSDRSPEIMNATLEGARAEVAAVTAQLRILRLQQAKAMEDSQKLEGFEAQMTRLERTKKIHETNYLYFSQRQEQARIEAARDASKVSNIAIVQAPTRPALPLRENFSRKLLLIFLVFTALGIGAAVVREYIFDHTLRHPQEIQRILGIPLLASIPRLEHIDSAAGFASSAPHASARHQSQVRAANVACELVAQLVRRLAAIGSGPLIVGFSAPHRGAGVSLIASQVANSLYLSGAKRVLLASVTEAGYLTASNLGSSKTTIPGEAAPAPFGGVAPANARPVEEHMPVKLSVSLPMLVTSGLITEFSHGDYDCILLDLPPFANSSAAMRLVPNLHGLVLVLETSRTTRMEAQLCMSQLRQLACHPIGTILNKFTTPIPDWLVPPQPAATDQSTATQPSPV